jgi:hypothetical protein
LGVQLASAVAFMLASLGVGALLELPASAAEPRGGRGAHEHVVTVERMQAASTPLERFGAPRAGLEAGLLDHVVP